MQVRNARHRLLLSGALFLSACTLFTVYLVAVPTTSDAPHEALLEQRLQKHAVGTGERRPSPLQIGRLTFYYPRYLRENQTGVVALTYERFLDTPKSYSDPKDIIRTELRSLDKDVIARLSSSGFKVSPEDAIKRNKGQSLPAIFKWTITPEKEGYHPLVLDVSELLLYTSPKARDELTTQFVLNGAVTPLRDEGIVDLPVQVDTRWGIPQTWVTIASAVVGFAGFLIGYPVFVEWLKRWLGFDQKSSPVERSPTENELCATRLRAVAIGFRHEILVGRLQYAQDALQRGDVGCRNFLHKISYQRVRKPELMLADDSGLNEAQIEALGRYRDRERELNEFIDFAVASKGEPDSPASVMVGRYKNRLQKLSDALDRLIEILA